MTWPVSSWVLGFCHETFHSSCLQVNLKTGVPPDSNNETCTAGAGSLLVEFGILSRLLGDSTFEWVARRAVKALWNLRSNDTGLLGVVPLLLPLGLHDLWSPLLLPSLPRALLHCCFLVLVNLKTDNSEGVALSVSIPKFFM